MSPSFVTWPTMKAGTPQLLAQRVSSSVHCRSWAMLPGACSADEERTVWMESTTSSAGERLLFERRNLDGGRWGADAEPPRCGAGCGLQKAVPDAAVRAAAEPLGALEATLAAGEDAACGFGADGGHLSRLWRAGRPAPMRGRHLFTFCCV